MYRQLHNLNAIQQVLPSPLCTKTVVTTATCSQHDKFISDWKKVTTSFEKENLFHVIHIILPILRQFRAFGAHQGSIDFSFISITLPYYYFLNSVYLSSNEKFKVRASTKVSFRIVSTAILTHVSL